MNLRARLERIERVTTKREHFVWAFPKTNDPGDIQQAISVAAESEGIRLDQVALAILLIETGPDGLELREHFTNGHVPFENLTGQRIESLIEKLDGHGA